MPTLYALLAASASAYTVTGLFGDHTGVVSVFLSFLVWVLVFCLVKRWLKELRP
ncbi:hypothetical protein [Desulfoluna spongiiphila]|uniref:Uncharacterized protein n=1 Tax=Desulfoluna spongiiphila TaxID=419481 RepID=A0A1G5GDA5_9BACT|nr:hypothetical protein [Desulfoluna spongiiphila]SCY49533.1 hypothetical protein SAMN05216233_11095 [Desulfoluna spongiiphila]VVS93625.1 hypothetical protein DBB_31970 [Desulfoluna spongiiphila]